jgi:hypothetical protein
MIPDRSGKASNGEKTDMTVRTWVGGGNNDIYAASHWSPTGSPQAGDLLYLYSGTANMAGGNLAGDTLNLGTQTSFSSPPPAVVNLSHGADLTALVATTSFTEQQFVFNARGIDTLNLMINNNFYATTTTTVNIANHSLLHGTFDVGGHNGELNIEGGRLSFFDNDGASSVDTNDFAVINADVVGVGSFTVDGFASLTFQQGVGPGQTVNLLGMDRLDIADPHLFFGLVNLEASGAFSVNLDGITNADSYSYRNDLLTLFDGNKPIDILRLAANGNAFQVTENAAGVTVGPGVYSAQNPPPSGTNLLPEHGATLSA